jgi:hypothetical protein
MLPEVALQQSLAVGAGVVKVPDGEPYVTCSVFGDGSIDRIEGETFGIWLVRVDVVH